MTRFKFYLDKINMLAHFIWWREWELVREEWNLTYEEMLDAEARSDEICQEAAERLLRALAAQELTEEAQKLGLDY